MTGTDIDRRAGAQILRELALFNRAVVFFENEIDPQIRGELSQVVEKWLSSHGWKGESDATEDFASVWVAPAHWLAESDGDEYVASFSLVIGGDAESLSYDVADLFGVGDANYGFLFDVKHGWFGGKAKWNIYAKTLGELGQKLSEQGFSHQGKGAFFKPLPLQVSQLITAWDTEDYAEALAPLQKVLDELKAAVPVFDEIIRGGKI